MLVDIVIGAEHSIATLNIIRQWDQAHMKPGVFRIPIHPHVGQEGYDRVRLRGVPDGVLMLLKERGIRCKVCNRGALRG